MTTTGTGPLAVAGRTSTAEISTLMAGQLLYNVAAEAFGDDGNEAGAGFFGADDGPGYGGDIFRDKAVGIAGELFEELGRRWSRHMTGGEEGAVVQAQGVGNIWGGVGFGGVVVGGVGIAVRALAKGLGAELVEPVLLSQLGGEGDGRLGEVARAARWEAVAVLSRASAPRQSTRGKRAALDGALYFLRSRPLCRGKHASLVEQPSSSAIRRAVEEVG